MAGRINVKKASSKTRRKAGVVLLGALLIIFFLSLLLGAAMLRSQMQVRTSRQRMDVQEAFYAAEAGVDRAVFELRRNPAWLAGEEFQHTPLKTPPAAGEKTAGYFSIFVDPDGGEYHGLKTQWIKSVGEDSHRDLTRAIAARVIVENPTRFLVSTPGRLRIKSGSSVDADVLAYDLLFAVYPSEDDPSIRIDGTAYYMNTSTGHEDPHVIITGGGGAPVKTAAVTFPGVDRTYYRHLAHLNEAENRGLYVDGDLTLDVGDLNSLRSLIDEADTPLDSGENFEPVLIFAEGDIQVEGDYPYSLLLVAGGDLKITGDILPDTGGTPESRPQIGLFAARDVLVTDGVPAGGALSLEAFVMAGGEDGSDGVFSTTLPNSSRGTLSFSGAISVSGRAETGVDMAAFVTREYAHNEELNTNRQIPFTPFIVNIVSWEEVPPADVPEWTEP